MRLHLGVLVSVLLSCFWCAEAVAVNRTIDDTTGDSATGNRPVYAPSTTGVWEDATCKGCAIQPVPAQAFKGTWTAATYNPGLGSMSIELSFHGTAIYVFFILANFVADGITAETACNFTLDGRPAGSFEHVPSTSTDLQYNSLVFSQASLANVDHKLIISTSGITDRDIYVNFDYAIYTFDDTPIPSPTASSSSTASPSPSASSSSTQLSPSSISSSRSGTGPTSPTSTSQTPGTNSHDLNGSSASKPNVGAIAGGVVGGVVALSVFILIFICLRRQKRLSESRMTGFSIDGDDPPMAANSSDRISPFVASTPSTRYRDRHQTHSDFLQSGTVVSPYSNPGIPSYYATPNQQNNLTSPSWTNSDTVDPTIARGLDASDIGTESAYGGIASESSVSGGGIRGGGSGGSVAGAPLLLHMRSGSTATQDSRRDQDAMRRARQSAIDQQLQAVTREMRDLKTDLSRQPSVRAAAAERAREETEIAQMREQMRLMQEQIEFLRSQQSSEWAQGLTDEPPPGYSEARNVGTVQG
ncbi:hypothetical protein LshimejAT787_0201700 [Lyophyllum shimeji]|uniref:Uncharacterized protein n=1 Tax=Lyophyllum shimeji TaxID=47721 RepID=A0A9P3PER4_LYOSH|nr:hypothetical protein LshimejAT787_0201700 [Lyophyllum shimeji]